MTVTHDNLRISLANLFYWLSVFIFLPVLPFFYKSIGFSNQKIGILIGTLSLGALLFRVLAGKAADTIGCKYISQSGMVISFGAIILYFFTGNWLVLLFARFLHGIGCAFYSAASLTMVTLINSEHKLKNALSIYTLCTVSGISISTGVAYVLYIHSNIQVIIYLSLIFVVLSLLLFPRGAQIVKVIEKPQTQKSGFIKDILCNYNIYRPTINQFFVYFSYGAIIIFFPIMLSHGGMKSYLWLFYAVYAISVISARLSLKKTTNVISSRILAYIVLCLVSMALFLVSLPHNLFTLIIVGLSLGIGVGYATPMFISDITANTNTHIRGSAIGFFSMAIDVGLGISPVIVGSLDKHISFESVFIILSGIVLLNCVLLCFRK